MAIFHFNARLLQNSTLPLLLNVSLDCPQAAVSCYGVSADRIALAGKILRRRPRLRRVDALSSDWKVLLTNNSCSTDFSVGYPTTSGSISARQTLLFT